MHSDVSYTHVDRAIQQMILRAANDGSSDRTRVDGLGTLAVASRVAGPPQLAVTAVVSVNEAASLHCSAQSDCCDYILALALEHVMSSAGRKSHI
jgi:hypothetical protein